MIKLTYTKVGSYNIRLYYFNNNKFFDIYAYSTRGLNHIGSEYFKCYQIIKSKEFVKKINLDEYKRFVNMHD